MIDETLLKEVTRRLVEGFHPVRIILFGSHARGTADDQSDLDLLILHTLENGGSRRELSVEMDRALRGLDLPRDIVVMTPDEFELDRQIPGTVARPASMHGRVLYDRAA